MRRRAEAQSVADASPRAHPPVAARLADGRWHFQHGPIDVILELTGERAACERALGACRRRFDTVLDELVGELPELRRPMSEAPRVTGPVAARMLAACAPFAPERFLTAMAAVAGAVADELLACCLLPGIARVVVNDGGDIALHLAPGATARVGICATAGVIGLGRFELTADVPVRGIATSGWRGRSLSLGIADAVTVLAANAAAADAAATLIANAVNCDHPGIVRAPADQIKDDSDLGSRPVTMRVPALPPALRAAALANGRREAEHWRARGLIHAAALFLQGEVAVVSPAHPDARLQGPFA
jgi:ApbE superfamily uncharacterized protein (UPF0280 family)